VLKELGHGIHEKPYENALVIELGPRQISCEQQMRFDVVYKSAKVGEYVPDLIAADKIIIDAKVIDRITNHERGQMINYLRITGCLWGSSSTFGTLNCSGNVSLSLVDSLLLSF
jgi:GxxExxY protein